MANNLKEAGILRLATHDGQRVTPPSVPVFNTPETIMVVSFEGLTPEEAQAALAGFPGGKRFRLATDAQRRVG
jgi:hypothetical protein